MQTQALDVSETKAQQTAQSRFLQAKGQIWARSEPKLGTVVPGGMESCTMLNLPGSGPAFLDPVATGLPLAEGTSRGSGASD